jgi:hypothetical protein
MKNQSKLYNIIFVNNLPSYLKNSSPPLIMRCYEDDYGYKKTLNIQLAHQ